MLFLSPCDWPWQAPTDSSVSPSQNQDPLGSPSLDPLDSGQGPDPLHHLDQARKMLPPPKVSSLKPSSEQHPGAVLGKNSSGWLVMVTYGDVTVSNHRKREKRRHGTTGSQVEV